MTDLTAAALNFLRETLVPSLRYMTAVVGPVPHTHLKWEDQGEALVLETAFAGQESLWVNEQQHGGGPGRGFFQFEPATCGLVLKNPVSRAMAAALCKSVKIPVTQAAVYGALLSHPWEIGGPFARLDTYCDPRPLPPLGNADAAWLTYEIEWRPGRPHPALWAGVYHAALEAFQTWQQELPTEEETTHGPPAS